MGSCRVAMRVPAVPAIHPNYVKPLPIIEIDTWQERDSEMCCAEAGEPGLTWSREPYTHWVHVPLQAGILAKQRDKK